MFLQEFLNIIDTVGLRIKILVNNNNSKEILWRGYASDVPFWISRLKLDNDNLVDNPPILIVENEITVLVKD
jgi:hypothetical protein